MKLKDLSPKRTFEDMRSDLVSAGSTMYQLHCDFEALAEHELADELLVVLALYETTKMKMLKVLEELIDTPPQGGE